MTKESQKIQEEIKKILTFTEHLRSKMIIPSLELQNFLNFQYAEIAKKNPWNFCTTEKTSISKSFKRAFKTLSRIEQAHYYSKCVKFTLKQIYSTMNNAEHIQNLYNTESTSNQETTEKQFQQFTVYLKQEGSFKKWTLSKIQFASQICVLRLMQTGEELDLNHYIMRQSKSKTKAAVVLQSIDDLSEPMTLKISNYNISYEELKRKLEFYLDKALKCRISMLLKRNRGSFTTSFNGSIKGQLRIPKQMVKGNFSKNSPMTNRNFPATLLLLQNIQPVSMRKIILESSKRVISQKECKDIYKDIITSDQLYYLDSFKDFEEISPSIFYNRKSSLVRRIFKFDEEQMNYEWLIQSMNCYKMFKKWKGCLFLINLLAEFPEEHTKIYHEIDLYKNQTEVDYVYLRHLFEFQGQHYFIDKSIHTEEYGRASNGSRGQIQYCLWRFKKIGSTIQIVAEVLFENLKIKNLSQTGAEYIGDVRILKNQYLKGTRLSSASNLKTVYNANLFLFQDESELNGANNQQNKQFKTKEQPMKDSRIELLDEQIQHARNNKIVRKQKQKIQFPSFLDEQKMESQLKQASQFKEMNIQSEKNFSQTQYYTIDGSDSDGSVNLKDSSIYQKDSDEQDSVQTGKQYPEQMLLSNINPKKQEPILIDLESFSESVRYLHAKHPVLPYPKNRQARRRQCTSERGHFLWRKEWKITEKGELININEEQIRVQSSVLKLVLKKMGRNLLAGKSILGVSLPIQIFATDSNLERLCKSTAYGPIFLEQAVKLESPVERMKKTICFGLGFSLCYIEMEKPFNPILGETYQGTIDGCLVYGQQISHHPPISSVFLKGRGYHVYCNLQAKVEMGLTSVSGINEGIITVDFHQTDRCNQHSVKFTCPPGQLSGLIMGDRKLTLVKKTYYLDEKNMLLGIINWGSQKKKNDISFNNDYFDGVIVKLKPNVDLTRLDKIKQTHYEMVLSELKGRWTGKVMFDGATMFDVEKDGPFYVQEYPHPLQSNNHFRDDIILRKKHDLNAAQQAKERLQEQQRNDRKLRKKYEKNH